MTKEVNIYIPSFIESVQISKGLRKKYYTSLPDLPKKYLDDKGKLKPSFEMKKGKLFNKTTLEFEYSNVNTLGTPKFKTIAGNDIYANISFFLRDKITKAIKDNFKSFLPKKLGLKYPIEIECTIYSYPKYANWDIDNLWIYNKCFQDLLVAEKLIPEDNVKYIVRSGGLKFVPIPPEEPRVMHFKLKEATDNIYLNHNMFDLDKPKSFVETAPAEKPVYLIQRMTKGKANDIFIDTDKKTISINFGTRKVVTGSLKRCLGKIFSQAVQMNMYPAFQKVHFSEYEKMIRDEILSKGIYVIWI